MSSSDAAPSPGAPSLSCAFCSTAPSASAGGDAALAGSRLLTCAGCHAARYCSREHQKAHWKQHRTQCKGAKHAPVNRVGQMEDGEKKMEESEEKEQTETATASSVPLSAADPSPAAAPPPSKSMAQMKAEKEERLRAAATAAGSFSYATSSGQSSYAGSAALLSPSSSSSSSSSASDSLDVSAFPPWCEELWRRIRLLLTSADAELESGRADAAVLSLTTALHLHAALPADYPRSVLHNLYGYRSVAYLRLPHPLPQLAVWDSVTSLKMHRDYLHAYGLMYSAWKAFGNEKKAWEAADLGRRCAEERGDAVLARRFADMTAALSRAADERNSGAATEGQKKKRGKGKKGTVGAADAVATPAVVVEVRGLHAGQQLSSRREYDVAQFQDAVQRSLTSDTSYAIPHLSVLPPSFSVFYPTALSPADVARDEPFFSSACHGKPFEVAFSPSLGRHLVATRTIRAGELVLSEKPMYSGTWCDDVCVSCWKALSKEDGKVVGAVECRQRCGHELYCSVQCRDERHALHEHVCGHSWRELRERVVGAVTTSALVWLLMPQLVNEAIREVKRREKDIRTAAIHATLAQQPHAHTPAPTNSASASSPGDKDGGVGPAVAASTSTATSSTSPLSTAWDVFSRLSLRHLASYQELPASFVAQARHNFDFIWAMSTLLNHWCVTTPPHSAHSSEPPPQPSLSSAAALSYLPHLSFSFYEAAVTRFLLNSHAMRSTQQVQAAAAGQHAQFSGPSHAFIAVGLLSSLFAHSCFPNCELQQDGQAAAGRVQMTASRLIRKGEPLTVAYIDTQATRLERAEALYTYGFACSCSRCRREKGQETQLANFYADMRIPPPATTDA